ncbi:hypothetical protein F909_01410 [Acinetobacter sp. ANC 3929]|uniref:hypothetical protein n=1 Tax=unclassified Acinetobacter TaxID=196816 RepID=UPI0002D056C5|nr:hypothetical protein [Acinetobacter sp. ANC 3929]ENW81726.1 hypothetical protein F909_01410 [Acinetobacter sp. ANC 3929]MCH7353203.1 hypothetical protein [Acinetobacter sp. NIPH 2023]MCH7356884.1 hypothetical protein [Acinetobacter sp. NIPH 1958]MCH7360555.1 hypothetical protein [Acinetobacter sp. NIPH 2024]
MKKWICKNCGLYKKIIPSHIKSGRKVFFIQNVDNINKTIKKGAVVSRNKDLLIVLSGSILYMVKDIDVYPEDAPVYFVYNMFGACECTTK